MKLFKLSLRNIRRSLRDYAIYFFTLIIGVAVFYVFNAIGGQAAMMSVSESTNHIAKLLTSMISGLSIFVAVVMGLLIVYASRFLMKRRSREFALYMTLGMGKGEISAILAGETLIIGIVSLAAGLVIGVAFSQFMSAVVANLFEADMTNYSLSVSGDALILTIICFAVMNLCILLFNGAAVTRMKLIDLLSHGKKSEEIKLRNPVLCVIVFILAAIALGFAYYQVGWKYGNLNEVTILIYIAMGSAATFFIFWSVSGMILRIMMSAKKTYFRGLNAFTFRQVSSRINTMVFSMTVICLMLFFTICALTSSFSIRNSLNNTMRDHLAADFEISLSSDDDKPYTKQFESLSQLYTAYGYDLYADTAEGLEYTLYGDPSFTMAASFGKHLTEVEKDYSFVRMRGKERLIRVSDYNALMKLYGREGVSLESDEYILICDYEAIKTLRDMALSDGGEVTVCGRKLHSKTKECVNGFINISAQEENTGVFVVPDDLVNDSYRWKICFCAKYGELTKEESRRRDALLTDRIDAVLRKLSEDTDDWGLMISTRNDIREAAVNLGAIATFIGLYIGVIFLIACGAILALKGLSDSVDSTARYDVLRKIGADEGEINGSLRRQTGIYFALPLALAVFHSFFGMKFSMQILKAMGTKNTAESIIVTGAIILVIYGGYYLITYLTGKKIIKGQ